ncbi:signal recognition particle-docking protein FtsY [Deltaproteobacteria bacterium OttesenSCG-928-K17]|nr:signal recognition particle-docking protein FtsY [Deltaproteobacteria bacterium OttesenSCG-928-K17]
MFDWFRKKKKTDSEPQVQEFNEAAEPAPAEDGPPADDQAIAEEPPAAEQAVIEEPPAAEQAVIEEPPAAEQADAEEMAELQSTESEAPAEAEAPAPETFEQDEAASSKGFFARFREKLAKGESLMGQEDETFAAKTSGADEARPEKSEEPAADSADLPVVPETAEAIAPEDAPAHCEADSSIENEADQEAVPSPVAAMEDQTAEAETAPEQSAEELADKADADDGVEAEPAPAAETEEEKERKGLFNRFKERLSATRNNLAGRIETLLSSVRTIDDDLLDELEELLITADIGIKTTGDLLFKIRGQVASKELKDVEALKTALKKRMLEMVSLPSPPMPAVKPIVIMVVGINGVGKTTTIAKLARRFAEDDKLKVLLAAGDTFRSAAVDQLSIWADRLGVEIVSQPTGADASAVVFDALTAAQARGSDVVIIDTAGRLHTKVNLMDELKKIKRVANKAMPGAPHHTILVLDGNTGQNAQRQAQTFHEAVGVDSIIVTKLDGTAKGGVIVSISNELKIPIAFVGLGESFEDLQPFDAQAFTDAILSI